MDSRPSEGRVCVLFAAPTPNATSGTGEVLLECELEELEPWGPMGSERCSQISHHSRFLPHFRMLGSKGFRRDKQGDTLVRASEKFLGREFRPYCEGDQVLLVSLEPAKIGFCGRPGLPTPPPHTPLQPPGILPEFLFDSSSIGPACDFLP